MKSDEDKLKDIQSRYSQLYQNRKRFEDRWTTAQEYVDSTVCSWDNLDTIPIVPNRYSSLPCNYLNTLVNGLMGYSISPNIVWFKLSLEDQDLLDVYGAKDFLEGAEKVLLSEFNRSNLYSQVDKWIQDAAVIGHGVLLEEEDLKTGKLRFTKLPANEIYLDVNEYGEVDTVFRRFLITIRNAVSFFGLEKLDQQIQEDYKNVAKWNNTIEILQAVMPREEYNPEFKDAKNKPYAVFFIDVKNKKIIQESGYDENPYAVFEWDRFPGFAYSTSPAQNAISDIKGLNIAKKTSWQIAQTSAEPPMKVSEDIRQVNLVPRGKTYVASADQIIEPIRTGENYPITLEVLESMKQDIKDWFYVDFFLMLQQKQSQMTATEVMELQGEKAATLSNLIVNLNEALTKIITRSFNILYKQGKLPPIPAGLQGIDIGMKIDFVGPLSQAQKKYHTIGGTSQALQLAAPILQMFPNAGDFLDGDQLMKTAMEGQGLPQNIIREDDDVQKLREERAKAQQQAAAQQQQMEMAQALMQNSDKMAQAIQPGSMMQQMNDQLARSMTNG